MNDLNKLSGLFVEIDNFSKEEEEDVYEFDDFNDFNSPFYFEIVNQIQKKKKLSAKYTILNIFKRN